MIWTLITSFIGAASRFQPQIKQAYVFLTLALVNCSERPHRKLAPILVLVNGKDPTSGNGFLVFGGANVKRWNVKIRVLFQNVIWLIDEKEGIEAYENSQVAVYTLIG